MLLKSTAVKYISICIIISCIITFILGVLPLGRWFVYKLFGPPPTLIRRPFFPEPCHCDVSHRAKSVLESYATDHSPKPRLAVLVPFRDRFDELLQFAPHLTAFLQRQGIPHHIFILNQADRYRFNRASLINVGYLFVKSDYDYIAMHDVDLLPLNEGLSYAYPADGPFHVAAPDLHPKYHYPTFVGGILLVKNEHFKLVNGMSNRYWGWGLEDDEFYVRMKEAGLEIYRPINLTTGSADTFSHIHDRLHRKRDTTKCYNQKEVTRRRDRETGLDTVKFSIPSRRKLTIDDETSVTILNISLECDQKLTPWCDCSEAQTVAKATNAKNIVKKKP
jgi:xylosylprotein 4-beta-galactosyltransferase